MMTPTEFSSRLNANPRTPALGNSNISLDITPDSPYTRAMPSPTSSTRPVSRVSSWGPDRPISCSRTETISSALNLMTAPLDHLVPDVRKAGAHAGVVEPVPHAHHQPAQQVGVDARVEHRLLAE